jgi:tetratricopeptide (TPR) repeat protein
MRHRSLSKDYRTLVLLAVLASYQTLPALAAPPPAKSWDELQNRGAAAFQLAEYGNAERLLKQAVIKARTFAPADMRLAKSAGLLGRLLTVRGRFAEAQPYLEEQLQVEEAAIGNETGQLIPAMGSLVRFYLTSGTASKADPLTEEVLAFVTGKLNEAHSPAPTKLTLKKGQPLQGWAGSAATAMRDPVIEWAITCDEMGNQHLAHRNFDLAERLFKAALDVKTTVLGKEHLSLANSYDSLGCLCLAKNDNEEAESYFKDALAMTEKIQPPENPQVYSRLDKLARCLIKEGKLKEAEDLYLRANNFWQSAPSNCGNEARAKFALGSLYVQEKNFAAAAPVLEQALSLCEQSHGPDSIELVPYLQRYAYALYYLGRTAEVDGLKSRASTISSAQAQKDGVGM